MTAVALVAMAVGIGCAIYASQLPPPPPAIPEVCQQKLAILPERPLNNCIKCHSE